MPNQDYWKSRFETLNESLLKDGMNYYEEIEKSFRRAQSAINKDIAAWYQRFAENNRISLKDAQKLLKSDEMEEFHWTVEEYIKRGKENGVSADWSQQLENASARFHISRLESLKIQAQQHLEELYGNYLDGLDRTMRSTYEDSYYKTAYTMQKGFHTGFEIASLPENIIDAVVKKPWAADGMNFSDRIWRDKDKRVRTLQDELTQGMIRGDRQDDIVRRFTRRMDVSLSNAGRLIATESAFFASKGELDNLKELGVKEYQFLATLDRRTSDVCRSMDMKVIPIKDYQPGVTAPPLHCWCRSCTVPYMGENEDGLRAARDDEGKTTYVHGEMPYADWKSVYVDKTRTLQEVKVERFGDREAELRARIEKIDLSTCNLEDVLAIGRDVEGLFDISGHLGDKAYLKDVFGRFREMGGEIAPAQFAKGSFKRNKEMLTEAFSYYPASWAGFLEKNGIQIYTRKTYRGFFAKGAVQANGRRYQTSFENYRDKYVSIHMNGVRKTTPFHEIGHMVEHFNPNALRISKMFIENRVGDEVPVSMKSLFPLSGYSVRELTRPDDFISPYIGKSYNGASEVLSMGLEQIFEPTDMFKKRELVDGKFVSVYATIKDDKEYLNLIIGMILTA